MRLILMAALAFSCATVAADKLPRIADLGKPAEVRPGPGGEKVHYFPQLPYGRVTYAARYSADGKLIALEQRLTEKNIARVVRDKTTRKQVRDLLGPPWQPETYPLSKRTTWTYPMRIEGDPNPKWFVVEMTPDGVVRDARLMNDPQFEAPDTPGRRMR